MEAISLYYVGSEWIQIFGNGMRRDTIIKTIDQYNVELAGQGIVSKRWLGSTWHPITKTVNNP